MRKGFLFKGLIMLLVIASLIAYLSPVSFVSSSYDLSSDIKLVVNGNTISSDVAPQIVNDRVLIPVRCVAEALGADVGWDDANRAVLINSPSIQIDTLTDANIRLYVSGKEIKPDVAPQIINSRVMVPIRFVAEALGANVKWDGYNKIVLITYEDTSKPTGWASVSADGLDGTTGGGDAKPQKVTTLDEFERVASGNTPAVIVISGTITCGKYAVNVGSNKTIIGENKDATIHGGISLSGRSNVIVRNLNFHGFWPDPGPDDTVSARNSHHLWFDHLNIWDAGDGEMDLTKGSNYITVSWCKFWYTDSSHPHRLCSLDSSGADNEDTDTGKNKVTYHHNWFADKVDQRMPRILFGQGHVYNNYYTSSDNGYCVGVGVFASVLVENNYFKNVNNPHQFMYPDRRPAYITAKDNIYDHPPGAKDNGDCTPDGYDKVAPFTDPPYKYKLDDAKDIPELVTRYAGPQ